MMLRSTLLVLLVTACFSSAQAGDINAGRNKASSVCASCHGSLGVSSSEGFPNLQGQKAAYLVTALKAYREGSRKAPIMNNMAANLTDEEIDNLAAFFSAQKPAP